MSYLTETVSIAAQIVHAYIGLFLRVIRSSNGGVRIAADVEGNTRLASFINRVTAQHVEMDQAAPPGYPGGS